MRGARTAAGIGLALALAGCTGSSGPDPVDPRTLTAPPTTTTSTTTAPPGVNRLVVVDVAGAVVTMRPDGSDVREIAPGRADTLHFQPQWAPRTGRLAWGEAGPEGFALVSTDESGGDRVVAATSDLPFYLSWAPDGTGVAVLHNSSGGGGIELELVDPVTGGVRTLGTGAPFYFSWSPDGGEVAGHIGDRDFLAVERDGTRRDLSATDPFYQAPHWTAAGIFHLGVDGLHIDNGAGGSERIATVPGPVWFVANPAGSLVAVQPFAAGGDGINVRRLQVPELLPNVVSVLDPATGEVSLATSMTSAGFFWSPDGTALAILVEGSAPGELQWLLWENGETSALGSFVPTLGFVRDVLRFAPQYAMSLRFWSPDSSAFAFVGEVEGTGGPRAGVWVQPRAGGEPTFVAEGSWVAWSPG